MNIDIICYDTYMYMFMYLYRGGAAGGTERTPRRHGCAARCVPAGNTMR